MGEIKRRNRQTPYQSQTPGSWPEAVFFEQIVQREVKKALTKQRPKIAVARRNLHA